MNSKIVTKQQIMLALMRDPENPRNEAEAEAVYEPIVRYMLNWNILKSLGDEKYQSNMMRFETADLVRLAL